ncbi:DUF928 domain-containing protein [Mastigocoleus testarum]|uniref:DUF928 domain-containing protein n=1 Tax=Mastigocoleus testarum BC008 TaxID=371196 RepID=A0A0V7ZDP2_9CYAN|nr:DUF928 domain-containing protein [Mastigocoleus testarum]KST62543.1 hypothetical protein BC008_10250 [Mastigocoleus testarum BC008]KST62581.1 hypothetical protein BC008_10445 [Mastigocoleus testarum BC008]
MNRLHFPSRKVIFAFVLIFVLTNLLVYVPSVQAQSQRRPGLIEKIKRFFFGIRPGGTPTGRKRGGAVRDRCPNVVQPLTALVPATDEGFPYVEQTIAKYPTFWFYIPYWSSYQRDAEFVLIDEKEDDVYYATFPLKQEPGIVSLQLPKIMLPLQSGKKYRWVFSVICNPDNRSADATVNGWVERIPVSPNLSNQLQAASPREEVLVYTDAKLWYEALTTLAELQRTNPQNQEIQTDWANLLQILDLSETVPQTWTTYFLPNPSRRERGTAKYNSIVNI